MNKGKKKVPFGVSRRRSSPRGETRAKGRTKWKIGVKSFSPVRLSGILSQ